MKKRVLLLLLSLFPTVFVPGAMAGWIQIARVPMPVLSASQWAMLRQQQHGDVQAIPVDVNLAVNHGVVYGVSIRHGGTGYPEVDKAIVKWITTHWSTDNWFRGGDGYVVRLDVDPVRRDVVFRDNYGRVSRSTSEIQPLRANVAEVVGY